MADADGSNRAQMTFDKVGNETDPAGSPTGESTATASCMRLPSHRSWASVSGLRFRRRGAIFSSPAFRMKRISYTYWRDGNLYLGFLNQFPDYQTQARTKKELIENLKDLLKDIESREVPYIRRVEEMLVA
jgi:hypothetical protein